jgi:hypothetical protein
MDADEIKEIARVFGEALELVEEYVETRWPDERVQARLDELLQSRMGEDPHRP